jgi:hypothetical protein
VPRYFFNFENEQSITADLVGRNLPDDRAARDEAVKIAAELGTVGLLEGRPPAYEWVEAVDEEQRPVVRLPVLDTGHEPDRSS